MKFFTKDVPLVLKKGAGDKLPKALRHLSRDPEIYFIPEFLWNGEPIKYQRPARQSFLVYGVRTSVSHVIVEVALLEEKEL